MTTIEHESGKKEHILECSECSGTAFFLGESGTVVCGGCLGVMNVFVALKSSSPLMVGGIVAEA
jgi:hypothetical protein